MTQKCVVVNAKLIVPLCPLTKGDCTWQHRKTRKCQYRSEFDNNPPSAAEIAKLVGEPSPSEATVQRVTERIKNLFKSLSC